MKYEPVINDFEDMKEKQGGIWWQPKRSGLFYIRSFCIVLRDPPRVVFPWRSIWHSKAPRRVCFLVWSATWDKILTCDNLMRRGYTMTSRCCMYGCSGESGDHLLVHCPMARVLCFDPSGLTGLYPSRWWSCYLAGIIA